MRLVWFWVAFYADEGALSVGGFTLAIENINPWLKLLILLTFAIALLLYIRIATNFHDLMKHFMQGDIFSTGAISNVRSGLKNGLLCFVLTISQECFFWYLASSNAAEFNFSLGTEFLLAGIFFGLMYTLLWTLEIGSDLNEESEMTI